MRTRRLLTRPSGRDTAPCGRSRAGSSPRRLALLAACALALAGCGAPGQPADLAPASPVPARTAAPAIPAAATPVPGIGSVRWTSATDPESSAPIDDVLRYITDAPRIIAASEAVTLPAGAVVEARWDYNNTSLDSLTTRLQMTAGVRQQWLTFALRRDPDVLWPAGTYRITLSLDGVQMQQAAVEVVDPA